MRIVRDIGLLVVFIVLVAVAHAGDDAAWGTARTDNRQYAPQKVLYDVSSPTLDHFERVLDRVSYLNTLYAADPFSSSIVLVLHGEEIEFFAIEKADRYASLMRRAQSLTLSGPIEFRMCRVAARGHGLEPADIHGFVTMVPMADAEIIRLQQEEGYAYMQ